MKTESIKNALFSYRLSFGDVIAYDDDPHQMSKLQLEQGVRKEISDGSHNYYLLLLGVKVNRKIYQPTEIEAELDIMQATIGSSNQQENTAPQFNDVRNLLLQRQVKLEILEVDRTSGVQVFKNSYTIAKNCYVYEMNPQLKCDGNGTKMYVKLCIFSMDKLMTLNKYSKAYVARKLSSEILQSESLKFGTIKDRVPLIDTDIESLKHLKYSEGDNSYEFIQPYLVQYNESFYDFMVRTANRCGEFLYFEEGRLVLGLKDTADKDVVTITDYETVTIQERALDPLRISSYARDSVKDGKGAVKGSEDAKDEKTLIELNQSAIARQDTGFPLDAFPENISSNAELAHDDFIFPLYKDKFTDIKREMYYDGNAGEIVAARLIPFSKTMLENEFSGVMELGTLAKAALVGEGVTVGLAIKQSMGVNSEKAKQYMAPLKEKKEQYNDKKAVQFGSLNAAGWTTLRYYQDILQHEEAQQRQIVCINMGTSYVNVKLGQKIKIKGLNDPYVIIQIQQNSEEEWSHDYDRYGMETDDRYTGKRSQKIYAIPGYGDAKDQFIPPVHPVPVIRKVGPQTAFVTDNEDPKYQGRVRIAFPWQSLGGADRNKLAQITENLQAAEVNIQELKNKEKELLSQSTKAKEFIEELKNYAKATKEEREQQLQPRKERLQYLKEQKVDESEAKKNESEIRNIEKEISDLLDAAREHDQKKGHSSYQDLEKDNTVISGYRTVYNNLNQLYRETKTEVNQAKSEQKETEKERQQITARIDDDVKAMSTPWVRIVTPMATPGGGTFFRPRVGDEVLVNFEDDNVERPYVVGSVFSKNNLTPDEGLYRKAAPEMQWKDISMSMMSPNGHHITFTDPEKGFNFLTNLVSPGLGFYGSVLGFPNMIPGAKGAKDLAGGIHIGDRYGMYEIQMRSDKRAINISSPFGTVDINAFSGITISAPNGDVKIKGKNITLEAGNKINLLSGKNVEFPGIGDPEGKANKTGKVITGIIGGVASALTDQFVNSVIDLSYTRHVVEVFVRPVDGTLKLKSKRYLMLEAGKGNATIRRDRYALDIEGKKDIEQEFFKAMLACVKLISEKIDLFYDAYETMWIDGYKKKTEYFKKAGWVLQDEKKPNLAEIAFNASEWDDNKITQDTFESHFAKTGVLFREGTKKDQITTSPILKFDYIKDSARAYAASAFQIYHHVKQYKQMLNESELDLGPFDWLKSCCKEAIQEVDSKCLWETGWKRVFAEGNEDQLFNDFITNPKADKFSSQNKKFFKRKVLLSFLNFVGKHPSNVAGKFLECNLIMDKVLQTESIRQEYYWNRTVLNFDRDKKLQNSNFWRTMWDSTFGAVAKKALSFKSDFAPFDKDIWNDKTYGQILFSDQESSTLNFEGEGVHEENSSNIGTLEYLKKELMAIK